MCFRVRPVSALAAAAECDRAVGCVTADGAEGRRRWCVSGGLCVSVERVSPAAPTQPPKESPETSAHTRSSAGRH